MIRKSIFAFALMMLTAAPAWSKRFTSAFCEFELPPGWECALEGTEWVCQSDNADRKKEAIIILAAKLRGEQDSLDQYMAYLKQTKTFNLPGGKTQVSEPKVTDMKRINDHQWVDSLHLASEVPGFYTRYLATVKEKLGVAVTFSVAKDHYQSYQGLFEKVVQTLKVFAVKEADVGEFVAKGKEEDLLGNTTFIPDGQNQYDIGVNKQKKGGGGTGGTDKLIYILVAAGAGFALMKMRKKKDAPKKKKKKSE
ncbi:MAG: hypothetical protein Fur0010_25660 [Bdellovibrio sp.]